ncbi:serine/threonine protein phosphatase [Pseudomonas sp. B21-056]|jgi:serine/threonine protein phosphatase PrpC|uniref:serine/threonine protein phosphatase n=1 Tax=Pseudomonas sp. B21-056 TaxID=2895495 RepID=UPI00223195FA|nr:serine/threonine protein phosphatase [Pseudomonas sp. B21-056]UZE24591.1 serine/threonine protein phosphatase [Pseudomonas sp. B21-056]
MIYATRSVKGQGRGENRDCAGAIFDGTRGLFVVVDGTSKPGSGPLAQALLNQILTGYVEKIADGCSDNSHEKAAALLNDVLNDAHHRLFSSLLTGSASYLVGVATEGLLTIAYEGDCCAGVACSDTSITWLTTPHCLANWRRNRNHRQLAADPGRHRISRSFKARKKPDPEIVTRATLEGEKLVFATDGFWADLDDATQARLLDGEMFDPVSVEDDVSWIVVQIPT